MPTPDRFRHLNRRLMIFIWQVNSQIYLLKHVLVIELHVFQRCGVWAV